MITFILFNSCRSSEIWSLLRHLVSLTRNLPARTCYLKAAIEKALLKLRQDAFDPSLKTHKLGGKLAALLACSCGYDCRIVFIIEKDLSDISIENIVLLDAGTHNDVY